MKPTLRSHARTLTLIALTTALLLAACGTSSDENTSPAENTSSTTKPAEAAIVNWVDDDRATTFPGGWTVRSMDGDAPILAVERDGKLVGAVEANAYPISTLDTGGDLRAVAQDLYETSRADRREGCRYEITTDPIREATVGGQPGVTYGFSGPAGSSATERIISYATVAAEHVIIIVASAHNTDGCIGTEEVVFDTGTLAEFEPLLERIIADTPLPLEALKRSQPSIDSRTADSEARIVATEGGLAGGRVWLVAGQKRSRIPQPTPLDPSETRAQRLRVRGDPVEFRVVDVITGSSFVVMPADGPDARLYLRLGDELYGVDVDQISQSDIDALTDDPTLTSRITLAEGNAAT